MRSTATSILSSTWRACTRRVPILEDVHKVHHEGVKALTYMHSAGLVHRTVKC